MLLQPPDPRHLDPFPWELHEQGSQTAHIQPLLPKSHWNTFPLGNEFLRFPWASSLTASEVKARENKFISQQKRAGSKSIFCCHSGIDFLFPKIINVFPQSLWHLSSLVPCSISHPGAVPSLWCHPSGWMNSVGTFAPAAHYSTWIFSTELLPLHQIFHYFPESFFVLFPSFLTVVQGKDHGWVPLLGISWWLPNLDSLALSNPSQAALGISPDEAVGASLLIFFPSLPLILLSQRTAGLFSERCIQGVISAWALFTTPDH